MLHRSLQKGLSLGVAAMIFTSLARGEDPRQLINADKESGIPQAVVIEDQALAHTAQVFPFDADGKLVGETAAEQAEQIVANLDHALASVGSSLDAAVRVNVFAASQKDVRAAIMLLGGKTFAGKKAPALTIVVTPLPDANMRLAMDAVAIVAKDPPKEVVQRTAKELHAKGFAGHAAMHAAVLPRGDALYISGQAEKGDTLKAATLATMAGLERTLKEYKLGRAQIVELKAFLTPMSSAADVEAALAEFFGDEPIPPVTYVEWVAGPGSIEIELIAAAPQANAESSEASSYLTPPWMQASPIFCRVVRVQAKKLIYTSSITSKTMGPGESQCRSIFEKLEKLLKTAGGDMRHLVKATYYVSDDDASAMLNKVRPDFYDPKRPPAASKAAVKEIGHSGRTVSIDIIGVAP